MHQCHSWQLLSFTWQPHTHPTLLTQITPISTEIPPEVKASPHLPQQTVNNPRSSRRAEPSSARVPWLWLGPARTRLTPRLTPRHPSAHLCSPPSKGLQAQALTRQCNAAGSHNNPLCSYAHLIDSTEIRAENSRGFHGAPSYPPGLTSLGS